MFKRPLDIKSLLSAIYDDDGKIVGARATTMTWIGKMNSSAIEDGGGVINSGTGLPVSARGNNKAKTNVSKSHTKKLAIGNI